MKKLLLLLLLFGSLTGKLMAQSKGKTYHAALGVKVWDGAGITFKTFITSGKAIELIGFFYDHGSRITGLYEVHHKIPGIGGLKWYIGPGAHIGFYKKKYYVGDNAIAGIDGVLGLDYKVSNAPLNLSIDWQPSFEFADGRGFSGGWGGVGIRYTF